ncbi:MAG: methyltransferase domain-containing protein [Cocleimonas sp.]
MSSKRQKWDDAYRDADYSTAIPAQVLADNFYLLPLEGEALDLACGRAANAKLLAQQGLSVDAVDFSPVLLKGLSTFVKEQRLEINCIQRDIESEGLCEKKYDVIVVSYFLNRELFPDIIKALKPNGLLFYQTWSQLGVDDSGPSNPEFRLQSGELLKHCASMRVILYRENGSQGDVASGLRNEALIIAQKR